MKYNHIVEGIFIERPNRFIAIVEINGIKELCHVKNTGRCKELFIRGAKVYLEKINNPNRKTAYDVIGISKGEMLLNIDSQIPNKVVHEWMLTSGFLKSSDIIKPEYTYHNSRLDFYAKTTEKEILMEVKGVTLEEDGIARFPDAPTLRGLKHIEDLILASKNGYEAYIFFVIQMKGVTQFEPNRITQPEFADCLKSAMEAGVKVLAYDCIVTRDSLEIDQPVPVILI